MPSALCHITTGGGHQLRVEDGRFYLGETTTKEQYLKLLRGKRPRPRRKQLRDEGQVVIKGTVVSVWQLYNSLQRHGIASTAGVHA